MANANILVTLIRVKFLEIASENKFKLQKYTLTHPEKGT